MKKYLFLLLLLSSTCGLMAQSHPPKEKVRREVSELVSDLSPQQKRKLDALNKESRQRVDELRTQKHAVCDSIAQLMNMDGDQSHRLDPLFEREAALQVAINREMYATKVAIDKILTAEQRTQLRQACRKEGESHGSSHRPTKH